MAAARINGHKAKPPRRERFGEACPRDDVSAPSGKPEVWRAYDNRTGAYLGVVVAERNHEARERASGLYAVPLEHVVVPPRSKGP